MAGKPSFCVQIKNEATHLALAHECCLKAELAAFARTVGSIRLGSGAPVLLFNVESPAVSRRIFKLARRLGWKASIMMRLSTRPRHRRMLVVQAPLRQGGLSLLQELGLADRKERLKDRLDVRLLDRNCCRQAYLRGCFLGRGWLSRPGSSYHLEFVLDDEAAAEELGGVLGQFGLASSCRLRKGSHVVYLKEADQVGEFLRLIGTAQGVLTFENGRIIKEMRNRVNRLVNCETANVGKTVEAGLRQVELISRIVRLSGLNILEPPLRRLAELRLAYPEASLTELGRLLDPPLGKSGVNHRFRQLRLIAEELASGAETLTSPGQGDGSSVPPRRDSGTGGRFSRPTPGQGDGSPVPPPPGQGGRFSCPTQFSFFHLANIFRLNGLTEKQEKGRPGRI